MFPFPNESDLKDLIQLAKREDLQTDDVTSRLLIPENKIGVATLMQKETGIACGLPIVEMICRAYDERLRVEQIPGFHMEIIEGRFSDARTTPLLRLRGPMRSLLAAERVILNFLQHMGGVATQTQRFVRRVAGTQAKIYDTRKTIPGFRLLDKYAVKCGGGMNHRMGLYDGLLVKDNHIAATPLRELTSFLSQTIARSRAEDPARFIEIEVDTLEQLREVLKIEGSYTILLDNMDCPRMEEAVHLRNAAGKKETVRQIALTGIERIAVGALTHSAIALDVGLDVEDQ